MPSKAASPRLVHVCFLLAVLFINLVTKVASEGFYECVPGLNANPGGKYNAITNVLRAFCTPIIVVNWFSNCSNWLSNFFLQKTLQFRIQKVTLTFLSIRPLLTFSATSIPTMTTTKIGASGRVISAFTGAQPSPLQTIGNVWTRCSWTKRPSKLLMFRTKSTKIKLIAVSMWMAKKRASVSKSSLSGLKGRHRKTLRVSRRIGRLSIALGTCRTTRYVQSTSFLSKKLDMA